MTLLSRQLRKGSLSSIASFELNLPPVPSNVSLLSMSSTDGTTGKWQSSKPRRQRLSNSLTSSENSPEQSRWQSSSTANTEFAVDLPRRKKSNPFLLDAQLVVPRRKQSNPNLLLQEDQRPSPNVAFPKREKRNKRTNIRLASSHDSTLVEQQVPILRLALELQPQLVRATTSPGATRENSCRT